jgi:DNA-binding PadR family transcriptional regulator
MAGKTAAHGPATASAEQEGGAPSSSMVQWALLGLLIERPSYGYELARRFERTYGGMLRLSGASYIYTALDGLRRRELIEEAKSLSGQRLPRVHYRATDAGVRAYRERLLAQMRENDRRSRLLARQLAVLAREPEVALELLERYERECLEEAERAPATGAPDLPRNHPTELAGRLAAEERRLALDATLAWVEYARRELRELAATGAAPR